VGRTHSYEDEQGDIWFLKLNRHGKIQTEYSYGSLEYVDEANTLIKTKDNKLVLEGLLENDIWLAKISPHLYSTPGTPIILVIALLIGTSLWKKKKVLL
jgi:hypothetical protein